MFKFAGRDENHPLPAVNEFPSPLEPGHAGRRDLLQQISNFLLDHALAVTPANLALAQAICSGSHDALSRQIEARRLANEPITQAWLDDRTSVIAQGGAIDTEVDNLARHAHAVTAVDDPAGLDGRQAFAAVLERAIHAAREANEPLAIATCDIDRFESIDDSHGPDTGERVIQAVARVLQRIVGPNGHVAHRGGAAFTLLLPGLLPDEAAAELDEARAKFAQRRLVDGKTRKEIGSVTFSGGVADVFADEDPQAAIRAAGDALDEARKQGRNRVELARKRT